AVISAVQQAFASVNGSISIQFGSFDAQIEDSLSQERLLATLSGFLGALGLLLAMIGLYGVMAYVVTRRQREIGIRMALGANRGPILWLILRDAAVVLALGLPVGIAI